MSEALLWCEYILSANGIYQSALRRVVSYFVTDIEILGNDVGKEEKDKYLDFLHDTLQVPTYLNVVGMDHIGYGNSFTSVLNLFHRYVACSTEHCGFEAPLRVADTSPAIGLKWSNFGWTGTCPVCKRKGPFKHVDRRGQNEKDLRLKRWSPHEIDILHDAYTEDCDFIWKIPEEYRQQLKQGNLFQLERAHWQIVSAVKNGNYLRFDEDVVYHTKDPAPAGIKTRGWGWSQILTNFRLAWYNQVLDRFNEAIALDHVVPFRLITPAPKSGADPAGSDPLLGMNLGNFNGQVRSMLARHRRDPATWHTLPFPVNYQSLGGDATQLAPYQLIELGTSRLLDAIGIPIEMHKGTLSVQAAPVALRMFESHWSVLIKHLNGVLNHIVEQVAQINNWEPVRARLARVTHVDDLTRQMAKLQLMLNKSISETTGLKSIGLGFEEEQQRILQEERFKAEETSKVQEEMALSEQGKTLGLPEQIPAAPGQAPGAPAPGGAAAAAGAAMPTQPNMATTPEDLYSKAQEITQQLLAMPDSQRRSELIRLKQMDPTVHSLVKSLLEQYRSQARSVGGQQVLAQQFGGQAAPAA